MPNFKETIKKNLPTILTVLGVVGSAAVGVSAAVAQHKVEKEEISDRKTLLKTYAKHYWSTAIIFAGTSACIIESNKLNKKQYQTLMRAYASLGAGFGAYRNAVIEEYGEEKDNEIIEKIAVAQCDEICISGEAANIPCEKLLFYEPVSKQFFRMYERDVIAAEYHLNRNFSLRSTANVTELLYFLGLPSNEESDKKGWAIEYGYYWIDLSHRKIERPGKEPYYEICYTFAPEENYEDYYNSGIPDYYDEQIPSVTEEDA